MTANQVASHSYLVKELFSCCVWLNGKLQFSIHRGDSYTNLKNREIQEHRHIKKETHKHKLAATDSQQHVDVGMSHEVALLHTQRHRFQSKPSEDAVHRQAC